MPRKQIKKEALQPAGDITYDNLVYIVAELLHRVELLDKKLNSSLSKSTRKKADIQNDLIDQLERNGVVGNQYQDMISDYMALWSIKNNLIMDIRARGVSVAWNNGGGQCGFKKNESIAELNKTNAQMLKILNELGLKAGRTEVKEDDPEM